MSGGSFNYLCFKIEERLGDFKALVETDEEYPNEWGLDAMIQITKEESPQVCDLLLSKQKQILEVVEKIEQMMDRDFIDLLKAVEWWQSGDWGHDQVLGVLERINKKKECKNDSTP